MQFPFYCSYLKINVVNLFYVLMFRQYVFYFKKFIHSFISSRTHIFITYRYLFLFATTPHIFKTPKEKKIDVPLAHSVALKLAAEVGHLHTNT